MDRRNSTKTRIKGKANEAAGAAREQIGRTLGNEEMEARGRQQELKGKLQGKAADVLDAANDVKDAARKAAR